MRPPLIAANWKMNKTADEAVSFINELKKFSLKKREAIVCPPFTALYAVSSAISGANILLGAQNMHFEDGGAFTGEVSATMLIAVGCKYVILGHSERRQHFNETNELINKKLKKAIEKKLKPILCVGEKLEERETGNTEKVVEEQLKSCLREISKEDMLNMVIAYEPIWAIGTGKTATPEQAEEVHSFIRKLLTKLYDKKTADEARILYGGSVKPDNIKELMNKPDIDGALVGGASLNAKSFADIITY